MSSLLSAIWRTTPTEDQSSVSCDDALADLDARLAACPEIEQNLRSGGETGLPPPGGGLGAQTLRRWLEAEKWDVDAAFGRLVTHAQWRADYVPRGFIGADEVAADLACAKCFIQGTGPDAPGGRPLLVVLVARHSKAPSVADGGAGVKRFVCWCLDVAAAAVDPASNPAGCVCGLFDFTGATMDSLDIPALRAIFAMLQAHFPERLDRMVMYGAPPVFHGLWRLLTPFLDAKTRGKVAFVGVGGDVGAALPAVAPAALPRAYGGRGELVSIAAAAERVGMGGGGGGGGGAPRPAPAPAAAADASPAADSRPPSGASAAAARECADVEVDGGGLGGLGGGAVDADALLAAEVDRELRKAAAAAGGDGGVGGLRVATI